MYCIMLQVQFVLQHVAIYITVCNAVTIYNTVCTLRHFHVSPCWIFNVINVNIKSTDSHVYLTHEDEADVLNRNEKQNLLKTHFL